MDDNFLEAISEWEEVSIQYEVGGIRGTSSFRTRDGGKLDKEGDCFRRREKELWGWLGADRMGAAEEGWVLRLGIEKAAGWYLVSLPTGWDHGAYEMDSYLAAEQGKAVALYYSVESWELGAAGVWWGAVGTEVNAPHWPRLEGGEAGVANAAEISLLGVLRHSWSEQGVPQYRLAMALADQTGRFLGWQEISGMEVAHQLEKGGGIVEYGALPDWEGMEERLRGASLGREI